MFEKEVQIGKSQGGECAGCDYNFNPKEGCLTLTFRIPALITTVEITKEFCLKCARGLRDRLIELGGAPPERKKK